MALLQSHSREFIKGSRELQEPRRASKYWRALSSNSMGAEHHPSPAVSNPSLFPGSVQTSGELSSKLYSSKRSLRAVGLDLEKGLLYKGRGVDFDPRNSRGKSET